MGKSIREPRGRPRVRSVNFRTLWWLVRREAMVAIWFRPMVGARYTHTLEAVLSHHPYKCPSCTMVHLERYPERRYYP
jgi:hypothetical protein